MDKVPFYVESKNGHDTFYVQRNKVQKEVQNQLLDNKWATVEKQDGSSEILTKDDLPKEVKKDTSKNDGKGGDWKQTLSADKKTATSQPVKSSLKSKDFSKKFEKVRSITTTHKVKGG